MRKANTSGVTGVCFSKKGNKWFARIRLDGKSKHLGSFADKQDAIEARKDAEIKYGFHPNHGAKLDEAPTQEGV